MKNLKLNNGNIAVYVDTDFFGRPVYKLESGVKVCCINLDGTDLYTMSQTGEPEYRLAEAHQPLT